jgi:hypothetical protein
MEHLLKQGEAFWVGIEINEIGLQQSLGPFVFFDSEIHDQAAVNVLAFYHRKMIAPGF